MTAQSLGERAVDEAIELAEWPDSPESADEIVHIDDGINETFVFETGMGDPERAVCKFATFSEPVSFQAGAQANRLLGAYTALPVPELYGIRPDPPDLPPFQILEYLPGETLPSPIDRPGQARAIGNVIEELGAVPASATSGYGWLKAGDIESRTDLQSGAPTVEAEYETCAEWLLQYGLTLYENPPEHDSLAATASKVPEYLRRNRGRFPEQSEPSLVLTDFGQSNLLAPGGTVSSEGQLTELTGLIDLERAKIGPKEFNAVNIEFLASRWIDDPAPIVDALYDPLPFGPDLPQRDLYRLLAMGREVTSLDLFYEQGGDTYRSRANALVTEIERILG